MARIKTYIEKITPFIDKYRYHRDDDEPIVSNLIKMKGGDTFKNFHFNTALTPKKDDFTNWHSSEGMSQSVLFGFDWYYEDTKEHQPAETDDGIGAFFVAKGTPLGEGAYIVQQDSFGLVFMDGGVPIYCDEGMSEVMKAMFSLETFPVGWISDSLKGAAEYFNMEDFLQEDAYGQLWEQSVEGSDYNQDWNGKFVGFKEEDYYEPGPTPPGPTPPTPPTTEAFTDGMQINQGDRFYVDTTKGSELAQIISNLPYEQENPMYPILNLTQSLGGFQYNLVGVKQDAVYMLISIVGMEMTPIFSTSDNQFTNLTDDNYIVIPSTGEEYHYTVNGSQSVLTTDPEWNGTIISHVVE